MRSAKPIIGILSLGLILAVAAGCGESVVDGHTRPLITSINGGMTLQSDVFVADSTMEAGGYIPEDGTTLIFSNPPAQKFLELTPTDPYGNFVITEYTITYEILHRLPNDAPFSSGTLPPVSGALQLSIPVGGEVETFIIIMPAALKLENPIQDLLPGGQVVAGQLIVRADITFAGHESGSTDIKLLTGSITVLVANYGDEDT